MKGNKNAIFLLLPFFTIVALFFIVPLSYMAVTSFTSSGSITLDHYKEVMSNKLIVQGFKNSIKLSLASAIAGLIVTLLAVYATVDLPEKIKERILMVSNLFTTFAGVPLAFAFIIMLGNSGLFLILFDKLGIGLFDNFSLYSSTGLLLIYIYVQIPLSFMLLYPIYSGIQDAWKESAALLGANPFAFWRKIGIPIILPGVLGTFSVLFANAMGAYATVYALTLTNYNLISIRIGALVQGDIFAQPELAGAIAIVLGVTMVTAMLLNEWLIKLTRKDLAQ